MPGAAAGIIVGTLLSVHTFMPAHTKERGSRRIVGMELHEAIAMEPATSALRTAGNLGCRNLSIQEMHRWC